MKAPVFFNRMYLGQFPFDANCISIKVDATHTDSCLPALDFTFSNAECYQGNDGSSAIISFSPDYDPIRDLLEWQLHEMQVM